MANPDIKEINGAWYHNGINLYASSREDAEQKASEIRPFPGMPKTGSLAAYTSGRYDATQGQATRRRGRKGGR